PLPPLLDGRHRQTQQPGRLRLAQTLVIQQVEHLPVGVGQGGDRLVELLPIRQRAAVRGDRLRAGGRPRPTDVIGSNPIRAVVVAGPDDQLPPNPLGRPPPKPPPAARRDLPPSPATKPPRRP